MAKTAPAYQRVKGFWASPFSPVRLYETTDHLLQITTDGFSERYKRFYFADIQAILIRRTDQGKVWNAVWGAGALFSGLGALLIAAPGLIIFLAAAAVFVMGLGINTIAGPTCVCHVQTAVQTERVAALRRLRQAGRFLAWVQPRIETVQGPMTTENAPETAGAAAAATPTAAANPVPPAAHPGPS